MSVTSDLLFSYLRGVFYPRSSVELDVDQLDEEFLTLAKGLMYFSHCVKEYREFASALARGDLSVKAPPAENELAAPLKSLQANLRHLTWQSQQVAKGDYKQHVDFMGEFADAFNTMVEQLSERQIKLENEVDASRKHAEAMEQSNLLLDELTRHIPEQIFVVSPDDNEVFLANNLAQIEIDNDPEYIKRVMRLLNEFKDISNKDFIEINYTLDGNERYLEINVYPIEWHAIKSMALIIADISVQKKQRQELEDFAYRDALTNTYNRFYGLLTLNDWINMKKQFSLIFIDLDNLKYVNDKYGHSEGDTYIIKTAKHLQAYSNDTVVCRLGGDEYMILVPDTGYNDASRRMEEIQQAIQNDDYLSDKDIYYSISYGIVSADDTNTSSASDMLSEADERMYVHKRIRKKERQSAV